MRILSLLLTLVAVAWLVMTQLGGNKPVSEDPVYRQATAKAETAAAHIEAQTADQAAALARIQAQAGQAAQSLEQRTTETAP